MTLPADYDGTINLIPTGLDNTSVIVAYNNNFTFKDSKEDWYIMDNKIMSKLRFESSFKSPVYDIIMPRVNG